MEDAIAGGPGDRDRIRASEVGVAGVQADADI